MSLFELRLLKRELHSKSKLSLLFTALLSRRTPARSAGCHGDAVKTMKMGTSLQVRLRGTYSPIRLMRRDLRARLPCNRSKRTKIWGWASLEEDQDRRRGWEWHEDGGRLSKRRFLLESEPCRARSKHETEPPHDAETFLSLSDDWTEQQIMTRNHV